MDINAFLTQIPKVELHCHLEGAVKASTFVELATKHGINLPPYTDPVEIYDFKDLPTFLVVYHQVCISIRDRDDFRRVTYETLQEASDSGVRYREMFWSPTEHLKDDVPFKVQMDGIIDGVRDAEADFGVECRMIAAINREEPPEVGVELVQIMTENRNDYLLGLSLDFNEDGNPPEKFWKAFRLAGKAGFHLTAHACEETSPPRDVETCISLLGCERIDHGYRVVLDDVITQRCADEGVVFTVIPSVQSYLMAADPQFRDEYPIKSMMDRGLRVMLNSDDPPMIGFNPAQIYILAREQMGFEPADFKGLVLNGIDGAWLDENTKRKWRKEWSQEIDQMISHLDQGE
jgi:adenosine deaminase